MPMLGGAGRWGVAPAAGRPAPWSSRAAPPRWARRRWTSSCTYGATGEPPPSRAPPVACRRALASRLLRTAAALRCEAARIQPGGECCSVVWTAGGMLRKQLTTAAPVIAAAWCFFQNTGRDAILCLLQHGVLSVHTQDGDCHTIPLPGSFSGLWPLPQGVLLTVSVAWAGPEPCRAAAEPFVRTNRRPACCRAQHSRGPAC